MVASKSYKYLDANGGLQMLQNSNLQFTNATRLNDPFEDPIHGFVPMALPYKPKDKDELIDWKEVRTYPKIGGECFDSLYFGINIDKEEKEKIIKVAKERNPEIKIYQMTIDPEAFRLKGELI